MEEGRGKIKAFLSVLIVFFILLNPFHAMGMSGYSHISDFGEVLEGLEGGNLESLYKEITSNIIDAAPSKEVLGGFTCGNHRWFGHWGFEGSIPFNLEPLAGCLNKFSPEEQKMIKGKIVNLWEERVKNITKLAQEVTGLPERKAKDLVGLIYNTHILGDWIPGNQILDSLSDVREIKKDIIKNLRRLLGNNSTFVDAIIKDIDNVTVKDPQEYAKGIIRILKKHNIGEQLFKFYESQLLKKGIKYTESNLRTLRSFLYNPETKRISVSDFNDYKKTALSNTNISKVKVMSGILLRNGLLIASLKEGFMTGLFCFSIEAGLTSYSYSKGDIFKPEFERQITDATIKGSMVGAGMAVAIFLGATPGGLVVLGIASGAYVVTDKSLQVWHEYRDSKYLNKEDLNNFGINVDSILDIKNNPNISLEIDKW